MGREGEVQCDLMLIWAEIPRSPGHVFYDRLQQLLAGAGFDAFVEHVCKPYYASKMGAPSLPPGRYFRMHMVGYFEGLGSERGYCVALLGFSIAGRFPAAWQARQGSRSFVAVEDMRSPSARSA